MWILLLFLLLFRRRRETNSSGLYSKCAYNGQKEIRTLQMICQAVKRKVLHTRKWNSIISFPQTNTHFTNQVLFVWNFFNWIPWENRRFTEWKLNEKKNVVGWYAKLILQNSKNSMSLHFTESIQKRICSILQSEWMPCYSMDSCTCHVIHFIDGFSFFK